MNFEEWLRDIWAEDSQCGDPGDCREWMEQAWKAGYQAALDGWVNNKPGKKDG